MKKWTSRGATFGLISDLDGGTLVCPCGSSNYVNDPHWTKSDEEWFQAHKAHTENKAKE